MTKRRWLGLMFTLAGLGCMACNGQNSAYASNSKSGASGTSKSIAKAKKTKLGKVAVNNVKNPKSAELLDACLLLKGRKDWEKNLASASHKWNVDPAHLMSIIYHESGFRQHARPYDKRGRLLSTAYGYSQALDGTWDEYVSLTGRSNAARTNFDDALDFIGWYMDRNMQLNGVPAHIVYDNYIAYYKGHRGYQSQQWKSNAWLKSKGDSTRKQAIVYRKQLQACDMVYPSMMLHTLNENPKALYDASRNLQRRGIVDGSDSKVYQQQLIHATMPYVKLAHLSDVGNKKHSIPRKQLARVEAPVKNVAKLMRIASVTSPITAAGIVPKGILPARRTPTSRVYAASQVRASAKISNTPVKAGQIPPRMWQNPKPSSNASANASAPNIKASGRLAPLRNMPIRVAKNDSVNPNKPRVRTVSYP